jgi:hypothetical protein
MQGHTGLRLRTHLENGRGGAMVSLRQKLGHLCWWGPGDLEGLNLAWKRLTVFLGLIQSFHLVIFSFFLFYSTNHIYFIIESVCLC